MPPAAPELIRLKSTLSRSLQARLNEGLTIAELARRIGTGRTAVRRVLDPKNTSITLNTMYHTARALGLSITIETKPLAPRALKELAEQLQTAKTPKAAARLKKELIRGFYGQAPGKA